MTFPTFVTASDEILGLFKTAWDANTAAVAGSVPAVRWPGVDSGDPPSPAAPFARIAIHHGTGQQRTLGQTGSRRFERQGTVVVQILTPISSGGGLRLAQQLAIIVRDAFEGKGTASGIWFRNVSTREVGPDGTWNRINVTADFLYDEIK